MKIPDGALLLHIGPHKTGSTAVQNAMHHARDDLAAQGVLYAGREVRPRKAGWAVLGKGAPVGRPAPDPRAWDRLLAEIDASDLPRTCLSNEHFATADDAAVERITKGLGADRTHVVFVARRLDKVLPSLWSERVKARSTRSFEEFLRHVLENPAADWTARTTWEPHDLASVVDRWAKHVPRDRITVVVLDEIDRNLLPRTFEGLLGLSGGTLKPSDTANASLTYTQTEAIRCLNKMSTADDWTPQEYRWIVQSAIVKALRELGPDQGPRIAGLPDWAHEMVSARSVAQVAAIGSAGVNVVGEPARLLLTDVPSVDLPAPVAEFSADLVAALVSGAVKGTKHMHALRRRGPATPPPRRKLTTRLSQRIARTFRLS